MIAIGPQRSFYQSLKTVNQFFMQVTEERLLTQPGMDSLRKELLEDDRAVLRRSPCRPGR